MLGAVNFARWALGIVAMPVMIAVSAMLAVLTVPLIGLRALLRRAGRDGDRPGDDAAD
jgi:hypothetical protein